MLRVFRYMVASRGGYRMARGRHYAKLSLSNAARLSRLSFSDLCILLFLFLSLCRLCVCVFLSLLSLELGRCSSDLFSVQQTTYRIGNHVYYWVWLRPDRLM